MASELAITAPSTRRLNVRLVVFIPLTPNGLVSSPSNPTGQARRMRSGLHPTTSGALRQFVTECLLEPFVDLRARRRIILRPLMLDLERAHQARETAGGRPAQTLLDAVQQATPERIAATRGVQHLLCLDGRNLFDAASMVNLRPVFAARHDQRIDVASNLFDRPARL